MIGIRKAVEADIHFLVDGIIDAEKSGTDRLSYCRIFNIAESELRALLMDVLAEDITGQELCVSGFLIAETEGELAGAVCSWVEGAEGKPSTILKGNVLFHLMGRERIASASANLKLVEQLSLGRMSGALQLESVYVPAQFRGRGICGRLLAAHQHAARRDYPGVDKAQILLAKTNDRAYKAYEKSGFLIAAERQSQDPRILELLPASSRILMEKNLP